MRLTEQLLVCYGDELAGKALSKMRLARWLCECISLCGLHTLNTQCCSAVFRGVCFNDVYGSVVDHILSIYTVLPLGCIYLLLRVCAHGGNRQLMNMVVGCLGVNCIAPKPLFV